LVTILHTVTVENERFNILWDEIFTNSPQNSVPNVLKLSLKNRMKECGMDSSD